MSKTEVENASSIQNQELATCFAVGNMVIAMNLEGITNEEALISPEPDGNCVNWVAGHLLMARGGLLKLLGEDAFLSEDEAQPYKQNSPPIKAGDAHVPLDVLRKKLKEAGEIICAKLRDFPTEKLRAELDKSQFPVQIEDGTFTVGTMISELLYHDGYHTGQLGLLRRVLGKKGQI